ncbi:MAG: iron chelate uptake ABC transporter family permease subunit [Christensenellales bacterium]
MPKELPASIILTVRLPRVLCVALTGASLSLCGAAMQGLLKNPLADGSRLACPPAQASARLLPLRLAYRSLRSRFAGTMVMAILFAFISLLIILGLAYRLDFSLSTNTIILIGVIYSMFVSSAMRP